MRETGQRRGIASTLNDLGVLAVSQGDLERGTASFEEALALYRQDGDRRGTALCLQNLGGVARRRGEVVQAEALGREGLVLLRDLGNLRGCTEGLELLASIAGTAGQGERAARLLGAAAAQRETLGTPQPPQEQVEVEQAVAAARAALGEEAWAAAYAAGRALSREQAVAEALHEMDGE
jgi:hypothetical protein